MFPSVSKGLRGSLLPLGGGVVGGTTSCLCVTRPGSLLPQIISDRQGSFCVSVLQGGGVYKHTQTVKEEETA